MDTNLILERLRNGETFGGDLWNLYQKNNTAQTAMRKLAAQRNFDPNGIDHYYHRKTMYEAAQKGKDFANNMLFLGALKEGRDFLRDTAQNWKNNKGQNFGARLLNSLDSARIESEKDLQNNILGYKLGLNSELPPESNQEFNKYNSDTVNALLKALGGTK